MVTDVVIPCRRETGTIGPVVREFKEHPSIGQVIVVMNGKTFEEVSCDPSMEEARKAGADQVAVTIPDGKGEAVRVGLQYVTSKRVIFCDGDLRGFRQWHVGLLATPVRDDMMILGVLDFTQNVPWAKPGKVWAMVTGERSLPTDFARSVPLHGYAMEVQLNAAAKRQRMLIREVRLKGVTGTARYGRERHDALLRDWQWLQENGV